MRLVDITGCRFGRLVTLRQAEARRSSSGSRVVFWLCRCDCGQEVEVRGVSLRAGVTTSCGCLARQRAAEHNWVGSQATYTAAHERVRRERGRAKEHACVDCGDQAAEWSYVGNAPDERKAVRGRSICAYSPSPEYYSPRCCKCHRAHDRELRKLHGSGAA